MEHASIASPQIYVQVTDNKVSENMARLIAQKKAREKETV
jgi:hypothetical protein